MTDAQKKRTADQQPANPPTPEAEDPVRPAAPTAAAEAAETMAELLTAVNQALTPDLLEAAAQTQAHLAMQRVATARDSEAALVGASLGEAFLHDAEGSDALNKLSRYERDLWNNLRKIHLTNLYGASPASLLRQPCRFPAAGMLPDQSSGSSPI